LGLNASLTPGLPSSESGLSCVTQSGGFGMAVHMYGIDHGLDIAKFCDLGNTADISVAEVLDFYREDAETTSIGVFLEAQPDDLDEVIDAAARAKPLILTPLGRTEPGRRASLAHIGRSSGRSRPYPQDAPGPAITARTGLEMLDIAKAVSWQPAPMGLRTAIITGSGGLGSELADLCVEHGLEVPELSPALQERLRTHLPSFASVVNPVDLTPAWNDYPEMYPPLMKALLDSDEIDILIITIIDIGATVEPLMHAVVETLADHRERADRAKPILVYWAAPLGYRHHRQVLQAAGLPCYSSTLSTARIAAAITRPLRPMNPAGRSAASATRSLGGDDVWRGAPGRRRGVCGPAGTAPSDRQGP
jgi:acyl-CoA synthetase (NDP forming)